VLPPSFTTGEINVTLDVIGPGMVDTRLPMLLSRCPVVEEPFAPKVKVGIICSE